MPKNVSTMVDTANGLRVGAAVLLPAKISALLRIRSYWRVEKKFIRFKSFFKIYISTKATSYIFRVAAKLEQEQQWKNNLFFIAASEANKSKNINSFWHLFSLERKKELSCVFNTTCKVNLPWSLPTWYLLSSPGGSKHSNSQHLSPTRKFLQNYSYDLKYFPFHFICWPWKYTFQGNARELKSYRNNCVKVSMSKSKTTCSKHKLSWTSSVSPS